MLQNSRYFIRKALFPLFVWFWLNADSNIYAQSPISSSGHYYDEAYNGQNLERVAFPIGGIGAGMFCLEGTGAISHLSIHNNPDIFNEPAVFAAISIKGKSGSARVLEGPVPDWKKFGQWGSARGAEGTTFGLARCREANFLARFPFGIVTLRDPELPLAMTLTGWSPFIPTDPDNSSLPVGGLEYRFMNMGSAALDLVFSYNAKNFLALQDSRAPKDTSLGANRILPIRNGFILTQEGTIKLPEQQANFAVWVDGENSKADYCWFRGGWYDPLSMAWNKIEKADTSSVAPVDQDAPGASIYIPFRLRPGEQKIIRLHISWYVPCSNLRLGMPISAPTDSVVRDASADLPSRYYKPWYSSKFSNIHDLVSFWTSRYDSLRKETQLFSDVFYASTLPPEVLEAVAANLTIMKSPTVLRQFDGRFWGWEGCNDNMGSCAGSCTHVWNYAQALCHLFPSLERSIRETELNEDMDANGHQNYRAALPIRPAGHVYYFPAADGQLGGIMKVYREWRISGDSAWLRRLYPKVKTSLDYCIRTWDPNHKGALYEPHHNTYDIEFWGADGMCTGIYLGALTAMVKLGSYLDEDVSLYRALFEKGKKVMEKDLYNGKYFVQKIEWAGLNAADPVQFARNARDGGEAYSAEAMQLLQKEGPKYQYGNGCLSDGVIGPWLARVCGLPAPIDTQKVGSHLLSVYRFNLKQDLSDYSNPQRPSFALGREGGLLLCTWPQGGQLSLPFVYSNEVWTGVEYEVASHLIFAGRVREGLDIVRTCRNRYDGRVRNPFDEYECGHWYARAMSSYALLEAFTGVRYDAVEKTLYIDSRIGDFTSFLSTSTGFGDVVYKSGNASLKVVYGTIDVQRTVIGH